MNRLVVSETQGPLNITAHAEWVGKDLLVLLVGGSAHIGAIGVAQSRQSLRNPADTSSTSSVLTLLGHKEDSVAKWMAGSLSRILKCNVVVVAGMHWDGLGEAEIHTVLKLCETIEERIVDAVTAGNTEPNSKNPLA